MAKFKLQPDPTFKAKVKIPVPGVAKESEVEFTFRFRDSDELSALLARASDQHVVKTAMEMATAWELTDEFNEDNLRLLHTTYLGALNRLVECYWEEHTKALEKN
jgi:hypothetical protein